MNTKTLTSRYFNFISILFLSALLISPTFSQSQQIQVYEYGQNKVKEQSKEAEKESNIELSISERLDIINGLITGGYRAISIHNVQDKVIQDLSNIITGYQQIGSEVRFIAAFNCQVKEQNAQTYKCHIDIGNFFNGRDSGFDDYHFYEIDFEIKKTQGYITILRATFRGAVG